MAPGPTLGVGAAAAPSQAPLLPGPLHVGVPLSFALGCLLFQLCSVSLDCLIHSQEFQHHLCFRGLTWCHQPRGPGAPGCHVPGSTGKCHSAVTQAAHTPTPNKTTSLPVSSILGRGISSTNPEGAPPLPKPKRNLALPQSASIKRSELYLPTAQVCPPSPWPGPPSFV